MIKRILLLAAVTIGFSPAQASLVVNFADLADSITTTSDGTGAIDEGGHQPYVFNFNTGLGLTVQGIETGTGNQSYAYLDEAWSGHGQGGMGVCTALASDGKHCNPSSDDNVSDGELLRLIFDQSVRIESLTFNNNHDGGFNSTTIDIDSLVTSVVDGIGSRVISTGWNVSANYMFDIAYIAGVNRDNHFYLESMVVSQVPEPSILLLLGSGLLGLGFFSRKRVI